jgi:hypothetical protein
MATATATAKREKTSMILRKGCFSKYAMSIATTSLNLQDSGAVMWADHAECRPRKISETSDQSRSSLD